MNVLASCPNVGLNKSVIEPTQVPGCNIPYLTSMEPDVTQVDETLFYTSTSDPCAGRQKFALQNLTTQALTFDSCVAVKGSPTTMGSADYDVEKRGCQLRHAVATTLPLVRVLDLPRWEGLTKADNYAARWIGS
eukprot:3554867-Amphidinium_carterae.1